MDFFEEYVATHYPEVLGPKLLSEIKQIANNTIFDIQWSLYLQVDFPQLELPAVNYT